MKAGSPEANRSPRSAPGGNSGRAPRPHVGGLAPDLTSLPDVVDRLLTEFASRLSLNLDVSTLRRCRRELDIIHRPALPELLERLARQRLESITTASRETRSGP